MNLIVVGGLDATGMAGLGRDIEVVAKMGLRACPVVSCTTLDDEVTWTAPANQFRAALDAAHAVGRASWMKVGAVTSREQAEVIAAFVQETGIRVVHDPVLAASSGRVFATPDALVPVMEVASLVTPNEEEAELLGLRDGPTVHVTRGGKVPGVHRGTGCRFATRVAGRLCLGLDLPSAIEDAHRDLERELAFDAQEQALLADPIRRQHFEESKRGLHAILRVLRFENIPEVGMNFAYALPGATDPRRDVCGLAGRITIAGFHRDWTGRVAFGGPHHTGRIAVVLQEYDPDARCVVNHRYDEAFIQAARAGGLTNSEFHRTDEPADAPSSMEWGFRDAIQRFGGMPDLVWDRGGHNKEAMIRVIGRDPLDVAQKIERMGMQNGSGPRWTTRENRDSGPDVTTGKTRNVDVPRSAL